MKFKKLSGALMASFDDTHRHRVTYWRLLGDEIPTA